MEISSKKLSYVAWAISAFYLLNALLNIASGGIWVITQIIGVVLQCLLAYAMYRERNDKVTMIIVIIFAITSLSIPFAILMVLVLCRRYAILVGVGLVVSIIISLLQRSSISLLE